ncbi:hypothetical protein DRQ20_00235 [bacterium]|nr:MAG: hypothetical protein DRQ20_00235 [bacterium]
MKVKIGIAGAGAIAQVAHIPAVLSCEEAEIYALCDVDEARLYKLQEKYKVKIYTDFEDMVKDEELDAVIIATPNYLHYPMCIAALEYGKYVLCEKPLGINTEEVERLVEFSKKHGDKLVPCFNNRLRPDVITLRKYVKGGEIGRVYYAKTGWLRKIGPETPSWRQRKSEAGGGVLLNLGIHLLDHTLWILEKKPVSVCASLHLSGEVEDAGVCMIRFEDDSFMTLEAGWTLLFEKDFTYFNLYGERGSALLSPLKIEQVYKDEVREITPRKPERNPFKVSYEEQIKRFVEFVQGKKKPPFTPENALALSRIIDAAYLSSREKREVEL